MDVTVFTLNHLVGYRLHIEAGRKRRYEPLRKGTCLASHLPYPPSVIPSDVTIFT